MKLSSVLAAVLLGMACASPIQQEKRYMVTEVVMETATVTVTASRSRWGGWTRSSKSSSHAATSTVRSTTTIVVTTSTSSSSQPTNTGLLSSYAAPILEQHNLHRKNHSAPDLAWDDDLANIAAEIASSCQYAHNVSAGGGGYGQNIGAGAPENEINKMITNQMYNDEIMFYPSYGKEPDMSKFEVWGHFSQIVWKDTTHVGCFTQYCSKGLGGVGSNVSPYFTVCNYKPVGNFGGQYAANVLKPLGQPIVSL
ncbi:hypothetical protein H2198_000636 [Neophaeococcomyces mojaviensis]|uniref:Uncharacterized protein n=1 Tax=Neophaeococcomyces mojaviensis TaxID=3383035 RepID=A0ACC3AJP9_9EURO|nr:hypothetical protein H2198_000636 [Knufia sp. JES_112]